MNEKSSSIERCSTGIGNYVFIVSRLYGRKGNSFLDKIIPVNQKIIDRLNRIYDELVAQWEECN